ncbi:hypothetical protein ACFQT0_04790 [Hymenobacter humi]|uniref:Uncharacterized protein n=1 Tax=Hymenobacter humi TaxID=1411620 RepID=A0ABW2U0G9_9BACT
MSSYFTPISTRLDPDQRLHCARRQLVAENILDTMAANGTGPDDTSIGYLQRYIDDESSLGQAVGRIIDHLAHTSASAQPLAHHGAY